MRSISKRDPQDIPNDELRSLAEDRPWNTDSPSPDPVQEAMNVAGVSTDGHDYVIVAAGEDGSTVRFIGDETVTVPVERSSFPDAARGVITRKYRPKALKPRERPFVPSEDVPQPYHRAVQLLDRDIHEISTRYEEEVAEYRGGLQRTYLID